jgi:ribonuclease VapC
VSVVLDTSAVLALLFRERGADEVAAAVRGAALSAVNASEVLTVLLRAGGTLEQAQASLAALDLTIIAVDLNLAVHAAGLDPLTRRAGLSLGDRCCLALARRLARPALTADRPWASIAQDSGVEVRLIR